MGERKAVNSLFLFFIILSITLMCFVSIAGTMRLRDEMSAFRAELQLRRPSTYISTARDSVRTALAKVGCGEHRVDAYAVAILNSCRDFKVDWKWTVAQMRRESYFNPAIRSSIKTQFKGDREQEYAYGLLQIKPNTGKEIAKDLDEKYYDGILLDGVTNIRWGVYYFAKRMLVHQHDVEKAVKAYNAGDGGFAQGKASESHWDAVLENYNNICELFAESENVNTKP